MSLRRSSIMLHNRSAILETQPGRPNGSVWLNEAIMTAEVNGTMWNDSLLRELTIVLVIKAILLAVLWYQFFSEPPSHNLDATQVSQALIASAPHHDTPATETPRHDH